jgi:hypothetical protein
LRHSDFNNAFRGMMGGRGGKVSGGIRRRSGSVAGPRRTWVVRRSGRLHVALSSVRRVNDPILRPAVKGDGLGKKSPPGKSCPVGVVGDFLDNLGKRECMEKADSPLADLPPRPPPRRDQRRSWSKRNSRRHRAAGPHISTVGTGCSPEAIRRRGHHVNKRGPTVNKPRKCGAKWKRTPLFEVATFIVRRQGRGAVGSSHRRPSPKSCGRPGVTPVTGQHTGTGRTTKAR